MTKRAALLTSAAVTAAGAWTVTASSVTLALTDLWSDPYFSGNPTWTWAWASYAADEQMRASIGGILGISALVATAAVGAMAARVGWLLRERIKAPLHGESHLATQREAEEVGIAFTREPQPDGILLGRTGQGPLTRYVSLPGDQHVAIYAPTGEGKGVGFVIPNCLNWGGSLVAFSVKRDLVEAAAAERMRKGDAVYVLDIGDPEGRTHRWNPLGLVRRGTPDAADDIQKAMFALIPPEPRATNPYWTDAGRRIATALAVLISETPRMDLTVQAVASLARHQKCASVVRSMIGEARAEGWCCPKSAVETLLGWADGLEKDSEEARGVRQTILTALALWEIPRVAAATATSDFDLRRLRQNRVSIFIVAQPSDIRRMRPIYGVFFQQLIDTMAREEFESKPDHRHRVLAILDEFAALGELRVLADATAFIRSSGLRVAVVVQSKSQTRLAFSADGSQNLFSNMGVEIALGGLDQKQAEEISQRGGTDTVTEVSTSRPRFLGWLHPNKQSESEQVRRRALMLTQEVQRLLPTKLLVLQRRLNLLMLDRVVWYRDPWFSVMKGAPPPLPHLQVSVEHDGAEEDAPDAESLLSLAMQDDSEFS
jgi:type IV secretion system protein VirD4